jgi:hypothetical protein
VGGATPPETPKALHESALGTITRAAQPAPRRRSGPARRPPAAALPRRLGHRENARLPALSRRSPRDIATLSRASSLSAWRCPVPGFCASGGPVAPRTGASGARGPPGRRHRRIPGPSEPLGPRAVDPLCPPAASAGWEGGASGRPLACASYHGQGRRFFPRRARLACGWLFGWVSPPRWRRRPSRPQVRPRTTRLPGAALARNASGLLEGEGSGGLGPLGPLQPTPLRPPVAPALPRGAQGFRTPPGSTGGPGHVASSAAGGLLWLEPGKARASGDAKIVGHDAALAAATRHPHGRPPLTHASL